MNHCALISLLNLWVFDRENERCNVNIISFRHTHKSSRYCIINHSESWFTDATFVIVTVERFWWCVVHFRDDFKPPVRWHLLHRESSLIRVWKGRRRQSSAAVVSITMQQYDGVKSAQLTKNQCVPEEKKINKKIKEGVDPDLLRDESACAQHDICDSSISITHYVKLIYELNRATRVDPKIQKESNVM